MLANQIDSALSSSVAAGGSEPEIVRRFVNAVAGITAPPQCIVRAGFIHQRPYAFFVQPSKIAGRVKCELGDILYVVKDMDPAGNLISARAAFLQAKQGLSSWFIEPHQLEFLANIKKVQFRFGNSVFKKGGCKPCIYQGLPHSGEMAYYLLLGGQEELCYSVTRVKKRQPLYQHGFSLGPNRTIRCKQANVDFCVNHDSHLQFLISLLSGTNGANLSGGMREIVELIYKRIGWVLDPPEEFADNFVEDGRGMAIIEISFIPECRTDILRVDG